MKPITTPSTQSIYRAPKGMEEEVGGLPFFRTDGVVNSVWEPTAEERQAIANGANILLGIWSEPIPPVSLGITGETGS